MNLREILLLSVACLAFIILLVAVICKMIDWEQAGTTAFAVVIIYGILRDDS